MSIAEYNHPAPRYVTKFLYEMLEGGKERLLIRKSTEMPTLLPDFEPPDFARFSNRLKVMAKLDSVTYPACQAGEFKVIVSRRVDGAWYEFTYAVRLLFIDFGVDPSVELRAEIVTRKPIADPDATLWE